MNIDQFTSLARARRSVRSFTSEAVSEELLLKLLECARWAPSGFNLQPTHFVVVTEQKIKEKVLRACLYQRQIVEAPALVVFTGDRKVIEHNLDAVLDLEITEDAITAEYEERLRRYVRLNFEQGPLGLSWIAKAIAAPLIRLFTPLPHLPAVHKRYWLAKQVMLSAMNFLLAAEAAELACSPIEGFDEWRLKYHLGIPISHIVPIIVAVGHQKEDEVLVKSRLPLEEMVHWNGFSS